MTKTLEIRPSTVQSMQLCPARTMQRDSEGFNRIPNEPMPFGSLVHWLIEEHLADRGMTIPGAEKALAAIFTKDTENLDLRDFATKARIHEVVMEAVQAYNAWIQQIEQHLPNEEPILERKMRSVVGSTLGHDVELFGTPDAVYPEARLIVDWKTAGKQWDKKKIEAQIQPIAYPWLAYQELGIVMKEFAFVVYARDSQLWHIHNVQLKHEPRQLDAFIDLTMAYALVQDRGIPIYTPGGQAFHSTRGWHCSPKYCDAWRVCDGKYLIADGKAQQPALQDNERGWS